MSKLRNESISRKLVDELNPETFGTLVEAQALIERWRKHYEEVRTQNVLGYVHKPQSNFAKLFADFRYAQVTEQLERG